MSVDSNNQWMVAVSTGDLVKAIKRGEVNVASFYGHMQGRKMSREVFADLEEALLCNDNLKVLDLDHNEVGRWEDGVPRLLRAIAHIKSLRQLNLNSCQIDDSAVAALCGFLAENTTLQSLWLYGNCISHHGAALLHRAILSQNATLKIVNLRNNGLPPHLVERLVYEPLKDPERPRPLKLSELLRLQIIQRRIPYREGVFLDVDDSWQMYVCGDGGGSGLGDLSSSDDEEKKGEGEGCGPGC